MIWMVSLIRPASRLLQTPCAWLLVAPPNRPPRHSHLRAPLQQVGGGAVDLARQPDDDIGILAQKLVKKQGGADDRRQATRTLGQDYVEPARMGMDPGIRG